VTRRRFVAASVTLGLVVAGGAVYASADAPADACESSYVQPMNSTLKLKQYEDCRFDRLERKIDALTPSVPSAAPSTTASPTPSASSPTASTPAPEGVGMPASAPVGWRRAYSQDFNTVAPIGQVENVYGVNVAGYRDGTTTTNGREVPGNNGYYYPSKVLSVKNNVPGASNGTALDWFLHTERIGGIDRHMSATPVPHGWANQTYGRYSVRMRADAVQGYSTAFLLWPESGNWGDGEIDFPEAELTKPATGAVHKLSPANPNEFTKVTSNTTYENWHVYTLEWQPGRVRMLIDGVLLREFTADIPDNPHYWALQVETSFKPPTNTAEGHVQVDWMTVDARS